MVGEIAPNFSLMDQNGNTFDLYKNLDKRVLLIFYPKDKSLICTKQLSDYNRNLEIFEKNKIRVVAINTASSGSHLSFCNEQDLGFPLLSDTTKEVSKKYNALNLFGINKRKLVLIDMDKIVKFEKVTPFIRFMDTEEVIDSLNKNVYHKNGD